MIFEYLNPKQLARVRQVSKWFRAICEIVRVRELLVYDTDLVDQIVKIADQPTDVPSVEYWFHTSRTLQIEDAIKFDMFVKLDPFGSDPLRLQHNLKRLRFGGDDDALEFDFRLLDLFVALEHLEIRSQISGCQNLSAPNLRTLLIGIIDTWIFPGVHVTCPKLETLRIEDLQIVHVEHKNSVRHLEITGYEEYEQMNEFQSLERLVIDYPTIELFGEEQSLNLNLASLVSLKELRICIGQCEFNEDYREFSWALKSIFKQRDTLQRNDLKIYLDDVETNADDFGRFISILEYSPFAPFKYFKPFKI